PEVGDELLPGGEAGPGPAKYKSANLLARSKVLYEGHAVAAVAAVDPHIAEEAARLIDVSYEVLPAVLDAQRAMDPGAPLLHDDVFTDAGGVRATTPSNVASHHVFEEGDVAGGFARADLVVEREFRTATVHQGYIEPHNALAYWSIDGQLTVECSSQGHFMVRDELSEVLRWPVSRIRVIPTEIGGGFGAKTTTYLEALAAVLARKAGRPVKMTMDRTEVLLATGPTPGSYQKVRVGVTEDGRITAAQAYIVFEAGAFPGSAIVPGCLAAFAPYRITDFRIDGLDVLVNKPKSTAYRAPGATQAEFAVESVVNEICESLRIDPLEFRLRNAATQGDLRADGTRYGRIGMVECLEAARSSDHWRSPVASSPGRARGRGVASGWWMNFGGRSSAVARLNADGTVTLLEGSVDIGGTRTAIAMQLAETLGIPVEDVRPFVPDTDAIGYTGLTGGSRVTFATGWAAYEAGRDLQRRMTGALSGLWDLPAERIVAEDGAFVAPDRRATFREAARELDEAGIQCTGTADVQPAEHGPAFATHVVDVEVDEETGKVEIVRYTAVQDAGRAVYPPYVEGQIHGGVAQGVGWALNEEYVYDAEGRLRNRSLLDYRMPTALDLPKVETIVVEVPNPGHPYGVRGVGEVPIVPPPAAIAHAIHGAVGVWLGELPMSPARVHAAIASKPSV
ncbi:MAG: xanthine dehydrogenase family protein molybdopterin-binding subunit, partial [Chloroflexi bacterium]|nr:xanthine dehydrogenase family protein molybdopterin-binding subunit [Chloroflexota bacterium]